LTINGRIYLQRIRWHDPQAGSVTPLDVYLDKAEQTFSVGVREMACRLNGDGKNFDRVADNLSRAAQVSMSGETLRGLVETEGQMVQKLQQKGELPLTWSAANCVAPANDAQQAAVPTVLTETTPTESTPAQLNPVETKAIEATAAAEAPPTLPSASAPTPPPKTRLYLGSDGVTVPMVTEEEKKKRREKTKQNRKVLKKTGKNPKPLPPAKPGADQKYKEFKVVAIYDDTQTHRLVAGTKGDCHYAGRLMGQMAEQVDFKKASERIGNVDGSPWIRNQIENQTFKLDALGLDFYHLSDNVHKARRAVFGEQSDAGSNWMTQLLHTFKHQGYDAGLEEILNWRKSLRGDKRKAADSLIGYITQRHDMIRYPEFLAKGWQIGSGPTEATCKTLTARVKGSGMRWNPVNAEALMAIEALRQSGNWKQYWQTYLPA
jgi:hypothetical protein